MQQKEREGGEIKASNFDIIMSTLIISATDWAGINTNEKREKKKNR